MPRQNRVQPDGQIVSAADRGLFWGNRGPLLDRAGQLARFSGSNAWIICVLQFKGRHRRLWGPGHLTELFFLDKATALAAGHRPCGECRRAAYQKYKTAWASAHPGHRASAPAIDARQHDDRLSPPATKRTYRERLVELPDGVMIELSHRPWLVHGEELAGWSMGGYLKRRPRAGLDEVTVLTPRSTVETLRHGYRPAVHPTVSQ